MKRYFPSEIEKKWQEKWQKDGLYKFDESAKTPKYYNLVELPYPSGDLHMGHWFAFAPADAHARYKRMNGLNVFFPNGFDAFGLPAENAAIKRGVHPKDWTLKNVETMEKQFATMGTMIDWSHEVVTCLPEYYRWNQWIFLKMFEKGVAYRGKALSNWCPTDQTVLANEHIENGKCWRCGTEVIQKEIEQWFLAITKYADKLIWPTSAEASVGKPEVEWPASNTSQSDAGWPKQVREGQNNWIGRSEGMLLQFPISNFQFPMKSSQRPEVSSQESSIEVFTTRPETTDGTTFMVVAPEHPFAQNIKTKAVQDYIKQAQKKTEMERKEDRTKSGVFSGKYVKNPLTGKEIPVWIADYVLAGYGTGAIMAVPFADERDREFAEKFKLPIIETSFKAKPEGKKMVNYHLRDWSVSRQRYWGTPVPIIHCEKCGLVPVLLEKLPVELPYNVDWTPKGKPPLATDEQWLNVSCPKCGGKAKRDAETLDTFFDSAWYYYRYCSPDFKNGPFNQEKVSQLMPIDVYFGGAEHTLGHTLYARFFTKFFKDLGLVQFSEFAQKRVQHGVILGPDGNRMSKSKGNVVNPDDVVKEYGADAVRLYLCFMMPYEATAPWSTSAISGIYRFLKRIWELSEKVSETKLTQSDSVRMHKTIKKVGDDLNNFQFNTAVAALMTWLNYLSAKEKVDKEEYATLLRLLAPFAPHITEELWHLINPSANSIHLENWPLYQAKYLVEEMVSVVVQVNGKLRDTLTIQNTKIKEQKEIEEAVKHSLKVSKYLENQSIKKVIYVEGKLINFVVG
jgi:leucyl-tRNA synthetase